MISSICAIIILSLILASICEKLNLPRLVGMVLAGIILGPYGLDFIDQSILNISEGIKTIVLVIILTRAGLSLELKSLKKIGFSAFLMSFLPATFEILGVIIIAPRIFSISLLEAALLGSVLAAVSPAVVVPRMIKLIDEGYGTKKGVPQLILAGSAIDDVFVIVVFTSILSLLQKQEFSALNLVNIPITIILGIGIGYISGYLVSKTFKKIVTDKTISSIIVLCISLILVLIEENNPFRINFSSLIAVMFMGIAIRKYNQNLSGILTSSYNEMWKLGEIFLFSLLGASVNINYATNLGMKPIYLIVFALVFRLIGVIISIWSTDFNLKEKIFTVISYIPKATVQAAIGGIPLALNLSSGELILSVAVVSILVTAPIGALLIDNSYKKLLQKT